MFSLPVMRQLFPLANKAMTFPLSGAVKRGERKEEKEGKKKNRNQAIDKQRVCFIACKKWDLASLLEECFP